MRRYGQSRLARDPIRCGPGHKVGVSGAKRCGATSANADPHKAYRAQRMSVFEQKTGILRRALSSGTPGTSGSTAVDIAIKMGPSAWRDCRSRSARCWRQSRWFQRARSTRRAARQSPATQHHLAGCGSCQRLQPWSAFGLAGGCRARRRSRNGARRGARVSGSPAGGVRVSLPGA